MTELTHIKEYVFKTAKVIASVIDEEVVICDSSMNIIGDSKLGNLIELENTYISERSILLNAMNKQRIITMDDIKNATKGCKNCVNIDTCDINSIIAYPIVKNDRVLGCIGLYSKEMYMDNPDADRKVFLIDFVSKMAELITNKLDGEREHAELVLLKGQLQEVIENLNYAVVCITNDKAIIHANENFKKLFQIRGNLPEKITDIKDISENRAFMEKIESTKSTENREFQFGATSKYAKSEYVTISSIVINGEKAGNIVYFKNSQAYYDEINRISNNYSDVTFDDVIGTSIAINETKKKAEIFSGSSSTVLIRGESGTGKEIFSRAMHNASDRSRGPFIAVNCAAIPDNLLESELFGYEEGSFTGGVKGGRVGKFQLANKGTLFLDEVGELPLHLQAKLLRAIQEKKIQKLGSGKDIEIDIRIIGATNRNLEEMIKLGEFREDLYYRLNVIPINIPSLRERKTDIPVLVDYFIQRYNNILGKNMKGFTKGAMKKILNYSWPGNIRELQNMVEYCVNISNGKLIDEKDLPARIREREDSEDCCRKLGNIRPLKEIEQEYIDEAIRVYGSDAAGKEKAAEALGIGIATLYRKLRQET